MKWIGQHIWDFISRFRSHVYLEATETGTIASGGNLGLDSNNKIVKATGVSSATLASTVTVTDSNDSTYFPVVLHNESNGLLDDTGSFEYMPGLGLLTITHASFASFTLHNTGDNANDPHIELYNQRGGSAGQTDDHCGTIDFFGNNNAGSVQKRPFAQIVSSIANHVDSDEAGKFEIKVTTEDTLQQALTATGLGTASRVDIGLGYGTDSTTTIAGNLKLNGDSIRADDDLNLIVVGSDMNIGTDNLTIESSTTLKPNLTLKATVNSNKPSGLYFAKDKGSAGADNDFIGEIHFVSDNDAQEQISFANIQSQVRLAADGAEEGRFAIGVKNTNHVSLPQESFALVSNGAVTDATIGMGTTSTTTITGTLTMGSTAAMTNAGLLSVAAQTNITSLGTLTGLTTSGTIELGHATDTTLARSASGKVTIEGNEIITTATTEGVVRNSTITIDQSGMNNLHSTEAELVADPGSGKWIVPLESHVYVTRNSNNNNSVNLHLSWDGSVTLAETPYLWKRFFYNEVASVFYRMVRYTSDHGNFNPSNKNLTLKMSGAIDVDSVTSMKVYTQYMIIDY